MSSADKYDHVTEGRRKGGLPRLSAASHCDVCYNLGAMNLTRFMLDVTRLATAAVQGIWES